MKCSTAILTARFLECFLCIRHQPLYFNAMLLIFVTCQNYFRYQLGEGTLSEWVKHYFWLYLQDLGL